LEELKLLLESSNTFKELDEAKLKIMVQYNWDNN
jgi:hypothetical protein